jgi:hypothetical protein
LRNRIGAPLEQVAQKHSMAALTRLRARLGDVAFELEWAEAQSQLGCSKEINIRRR